MYAASEGHVDICRLLVESGADTAVKRYDHVARWLSCPRTQVTALDHRDDNTALKIAIMFGKSHVVTYLRSVGAPL